MRNLDDFHRMFHREVELCHWGLVDLSHRPERPMRRE